MQDLRASEAPGANDPNGSSYGKLDGDWAIANLEKAVALAGAPKIAHWTVERLVELAPTRPSTVARVVAAILERPEDEWDHIG